MSTVHRRSAGSSLLPAEAKQFFRVMNRLQFFVNQRLDLVPGISTLDDFVAADIEDKAVVRDALYDNPELFDAFLSDPRNELNEEERTLVRSWNEQRVAGNFFIERHLRKHSIWIGSGSDGDSDEVFAVLGISHPIDELVPKHMLPHLLKAVLLPFKGRIIFDGMVRHSPISFGSGFRSSLRETYLRAKQNGRIIESFDGKSESAIVPTLGPTKDWSDELRELKRTAARLKGETCPLTKEAFAVLRKSVELVESAVEQSGDLRALEAHGSAVVKALRRLETVMERTE